MDYNYYSDIVWVVDAALACIILITVSAIIAYALLKDREWERRRRALLGIKKGVYEMVLAGRDPGEATCQLFSSSITPQQFIDIVTNRSKTAVFFNESEQDFLKNCFIGPEQIKRLERIALGASNKWRKIEAILCLGYTQRPESAAALAKTLLSRDTDIAYFSAVSLGQIRTAGSARALLGCLKKRRLNSYKIMSILSAFPAEAAGDIAKLALDRDAAVRERAATLLSKFDAAPYLETVKKLAVDRSPDVRAAACDCLAACGKDNAEARDLLDGLARDDHWMVRARAVRALGRLCGGACLGGIIGLVNDASWSVVDAVRDVMTANIAAAVPYMEKILEGGYDVAKRCCVTALEASGYLVKALKEAAGPEGARALKLLSAVARAGYASVMASAAASLEPPQRQKALEVLGRLGKD
jgi:HEAT repeat protein